MKEPLTLSDELLERAARDGACAEAIDWARAARRRVSAVTVDWAFWLVGWRRVPRDVVAALVGHKDPTVQDAARRRLDAMGKHDS